MIKKLKSHPFLNTLYHWLKRDYGVDLFRPYLGGWKPGGDYATDVEPLWRYFYETLGCRTCLDVGCGEGWHVHKMIQLGLNAYGVEGSQRAISRSPVKDRIIRHDLTKCPFISKTKYDLVWCSEVVEHIEERFVGNVVLTLVGNTARYLAMTYAPPGSGGYHHVNCKPAEYWINLIERGGLCFDEATTFLLRDYVSKQCKGFRHFSNRGLVFRRK